MNKSAIALAVAAALAASAAAQAETTLYGSARVSVDYVTQDIGDDVEELLDDEEVDGVWDVRNNSSRLGVKGSEDLGNGLSAIYQYEFGVDVTDGGNLESNRPKLVGLKGGFGTVAIGTQWTPYYNVMGVGDIFNNGNSFGQYNGLFRTSDMLAYISPSFGGFEVQAALMMDTDPFLGGVQEDGVDAWNVAALYKNGPITAGATWLSLEGEGAPTDAGDRDAWGVAAGYTGGNLGVTLEYEDVELDADNDVQDLLATVSYAFGANIVRASYGLETRDLDVFPVSELDLDEDDINHWQLGFQHNLSKRTRLWVEYIGQDSDEEILDQDVVSIGMRHDF